ncbi:MAG: hypothetical protein ACTHXE_13325 [Corynebacterium variabile]|uniref:hypothetical protein n=1 Tax=Corynebacterium variabile TaxID=1727 RepID=UPI003F900DDC
MSEQRKLTLAEAATLHEVSVDLLRAAVKSGDLPSTRGPRNRYEVTEDDVAGWMGNRRSGVPTPERIKAWAREVAAAAPPVTPELACEVAMILTRGKGAAQGVAA